MVGTAVRPAPTTPAPPPAEQGSRATLSSLSFRFFAGRRSLFIQHRMAHDRYWSCWPVYGSRARVN